MMVMVVFTTGDVAATTTSARSTPTTAQKMWTYKRKEKKTKKYETRCSGYCCYLKTEMSWQEETSKADFLSSTK